MSLRRWFERQSPPGKAAATVGGTVLAWLALAFILGLACAILGAPWWR